MHRKKVISKNVTGICTFFTFTHVRQTCFAYNFFLVHFLTTFSTDWKSAWNSAFFDTFFDFFQKKNFFSHICPFFKLWSQTRKKQLKKSKNVFNKGVLDFNFAPIHQRVCILHFLKKSQIRCTLMASLDLSFIKMLCTVLCWGWIKNVSYIDFWPGMAFCLCGW